MAAIPSLAVYDPMIDPDLGDPPPLYPARDPAAAAGLKVASVPDRGVASQTVSGDRPHPVRHATRTSSTRRVRALAVPREPTPRTRAEQSRHPDRGRHRSGAGDRAGGHGHDSPPRDEHRPQD